MKLHLEPGLRLLLRPLSPWYQPAQWLGDARFNATDNEVMIPFPHPLPQVFSVDPRSWCKLLPLPRLDEATFNFCQHLYVSFFINTCIPSSSKPLKLSQGLSFAVLCIQLGTQWILSKEKFCVSAILSGDQTRLFLKPNGI